MTRECRECGREFESKRGLDSHIGHMHPNAKRREIQCDYCGDTRQVLKCNSDPNTRDFCDGDCRSAFMSDFMTGENNPSWDGGKTTIECEWCGDRFDVTPAAVERTQYCSKGCYGNAMSARKTEQTPNYQGGRAEVKCKNCSELFNVKQARVDVATYCSTECMAEGYKEITGEDHPAWEGGTIDYYGPNWQEQRRKALERDNYTCQDCGVGKDEYEWIDVHHIQPLSNFSGEGRPDYERANRLGNLVTLCRPCHRKWEGMAGLRPDTR
jgi:DNA-directed RNA polymerase subunit RPC12/RpoP